jgi:nucleoside-diphosphate-sugar epimerase
MIFVVGGRGFVGSAFGRVLSEQGRPWVAIQRENYRQFVGQSCEMLINANGNSRKYLATQAPLEDFDASVRSVRSTLEDFHPSAYVLLSSCDVYPDCSSPARTSEESRVDVSGQSPYAFHKYLAELCVRHRVDRWLVVRLGGMVGPGLRKNPVHDILAGGPLWLHPDSELQFMHTDAVASTVLRLADHGHWNEVFNVCGRGLVSLRQIMAMAGRGELAVSEGSSRVRYDVSIEKLSGLVEVPSTRETVARFVEEQLQCRS